MVVGSPAAPQCTGVCIRLRAVMSAHGGVYLAAELGDVLLGCWLLVGRVCVWLATIAGTQQPHDHWNA